MLFIIGKNMNRDLSSYVLVLENWLHKQACKQTIAELQDASWQQHTFTIYDTQNKTSSKIIGSKELDVSNGNNVSTKPYIMQRTWDAFEAYITNLNLSWFNSWQGFSEIRFNKYEETRVMTEHCDHIHTMFDGERKGIPILSCLTMLNDDYLGGEFVMWGDEIIPMGEGTTIIFPSCFLYPHRVDPVTAGVRYSCISWAW